MRYIPRNCIREDAILARPIYGDNGKVLLSEGVKMNQAYIDRLAFCGINGVYIHDSVSCDLEIKSVITEEVKATTLSQLTDVFNLAGEGKDSDLNARQLLKTAEKLVNDIVKNNDVMLNLFDIKTYDNYTYFHCMDAAILSITIALEMEYSMKDMVQLAFSALLHDIGKVFVDSEIVNKKGKLDAEEMKEMQKHPKEGYNHVRENFHGTISMQTARGILDHHEREDGSGYPNKLKGNEISDFGKIIAVADVYDALVSDRPYRKAVFPLEAIEYIKGSGGSSFNFEVVEAFSKKIAPFPVGTCVKLSDNSIALVSENFKSYAQRPKVKVFMENDKEITPYYLNLKDEAYNVTVVSTVEV
ncbi:MAG: HD-GYP domain-containing protein [Oscillospiraceae bacterium]|nr:HD-GYP domain-containing protein [Oscillospiraceae bacterium]